MAEQEAEVLESKATAEQQAQAEKMGWIPPTRFKGDTERFVDADEYIKRGETVLPIVKEHNRRLEGEVGTLRAENAKLAAAVAASETAIARIEERHTVETQKAIELARKEVKAQLAQASEAGDHAAVAELTEQLVDMKDAEAAAAPIKVEKKAAEPEKYVPPAELEEWTRKVGWFGVDKKKTAIALAAAQELREAGETATGTAFFRKVEDEVDKIFTPNREEARGDKVEGGRNGSDSETRVRNKKGYAALPAEAKAMCDQEGKRFIGPGKMYKTQAEQREGWAAIYHGME